MKIALKSILIIFLILLVLGCSNKKQGEPGTGEDSYISPLEPISDLFSGGKYWKGDINPDYAGKTKSRKMIQS